MAKETGKITKVEKAFKGGGVEGKKDVEGKDEKAIEEAR